MMPPEDMFGYDGAEPEEGPGGPQPVLPARPAETVDYTVRLDYEQRRELGRRIVAEYQAYKTATGDRLARAADWRRDANLERSEQPGPWDNSSQLRATYLATACDAHTARLNGHIGSGNPPWSAVPNNPEAQTSAAQLESAVKAALERARWEKQKRLLHHELPIVTPAAVITEWTQTVRRVPEVAIEQDREALTTLVEVGADPMEAYRATVERGKDGLAKTGILLTDRTIFEGPTYRVVPFERLVMLPVNAASREDLWGVGERMMVRGFNLQDGARTGKYLKEAVSSLLARQGDAPAEEDVAAASERGVDLGGGEPNRDSLYRQYECIELDWQDDLNHDGRLEWYIVAVHLATAEVFRCQYCPDEHGLSRYELFGYIEEQDNIFSMSLCERLQYLQDGATAAVNQFFNLVDKLVGSAGNFFYDPRAKRIKPEQWEIDPAMPIQVDDVNGITPNPLAPGIAQALPPLMMAIDRFKEWFELLTASSNTTLGRETDTKRTLGEVRMVAQQGSRIFENYAAGVAESWERVIERTAALLAQYSEGGQYRVRSQGRAGYDWQSVPAHLLRSEVSWSCTGLSQLPDNEQRAQRDMLVLDTLGRHPLTAQDWPTQVKLLREFIQDVQFPGWEQIAQGLEQRAGMLMMSEMAQTAMGAQQAQQAQAAAAGGEQRAQEQHALGQAQSAAALAARSGNGQEKK